MYKIDKQELKHMEAYLEQQKVILEEQVSEHETMDIESEEFGIIKGWLEATNHHLYMIQRARKDPYFSLVHGNLRPLDERG